MSNNILCTQKNLSRLFPLEDILCLLCHKEVEDILHFSVDVVSYNLGGSLGMVV